MMEELELIIFDCDGTLVDSERLSNRVIADMISKLGLAISPEISSGHFAGKSMQDIIDFIHLKLPGKLNYDFEKEYRKKSNALYKEELQAFDGVHELLERITIKKCIASNGPKEKMEVTLEVTALKKYFSEDHIFTAYDYGKWKPDPTLFLEVLKAFDVKPENALVIEDTISGIDGALNAGIEVLAFCPDGIDPKIEERNVAVFKTMKSIENKIFAAS